jgi:hypothetical protein
VHALREQQGTQPITAPMVPRDEDRIPTAPDRTKPVVDLPEPLNLEDEEDTEEIEIPGARPLSEDRAALLGKARARMDRGEFWKALDLLDQALQLDPDDKDAVRLHARAKQSAVESLFATVGDLAKAPRQKMEDKDLMRQDFDHRAGFLLSLMDGHVTCDEIIAVSGLPQIDALRIMADMVKRGAIEIS